MLQIGIDLGGTKIEGIALQENGLELVRKRIETQQERGYGHILKRIEGLHGELAEYIRGEPHSLALPRRGRSRCEPACSRTPTPFV